MADEEIPHLPPAKPPIPGADLQERAPWWVKTAVVVIASFMSGGGFVGGVAAYRLAELEEDVGELESLMMNIRLEVAANHGKPQP